MSNLNADDADNWFGDIDRGTQNINQSSSRQGTSRGSDLDPYSKDDTSVPSSSEDDEDKDDPKNWDKDLPMNGKMPLHKK